MSKLKDAWLLIRSRAYIFINEDKTTFFGQFRDIEPFSVLQSLSKIKVNLRETISSIEAQYFGKEVKHGRKQSRRPESRTHQSD